MRAGGAVSLPMYDWPELHEANDRFWGLLRGRLAEEGFDAPLELYRRTPSHNLWRSNFLFSQTCGYPYITALTDHVTILGVPVYDIEGCGPGTYRSAIIARRDCAVDDISKTAPFRFAYNSLDSLSGYRCLSPLVGDPSAFFETGFSTGGHRASADAVAAGEADIAAIDCVSWHHYQRAEAENVAALKVIGWAPEFPALPFITAIGRSKAEQAALSRALRATVSDNHNDAALQTLRLTGVIDPDEGSYKALAEL